MNCPPLFCVLAFACSLSPCQADGADLTVFAAASLTDALTEIGRDYQKAGGDHIVFQFGASSTLARQIDAGAQADVFISADEAKMDALAEKGRIRKETRRSLLSNELVIVVAADAPLTVRAPADLAGPALERLALADPRAVPAGVYAKAYLEKTGLWDKVAGKVVPTENVRAALAAVESGDADAAIVYRTDVAVSKKVKVACEVPAADGPMISYPVAVVGDSRRVEAAQRFLAYLGSDAAVGVFKKYGFLILK